MTTRKTMWLSPLALATLFLFSCSSPVIKQAVSNTASAAGQSGVDSLEGNDGELSVLYFHDPIASSMSFGTGDYGHVFQDNMLKNHQSDIEFGHYQKDSFSVGIEGGRGGLILDLGSSETMSQNYGYSETVGGGQGFASIRFIDNELVILKDYEAQTTQPLLQAKGLFQKHEGMSSALVRNGHIYVVRITDRHDPSFERVAKFKVVSYLPGESVTIRWVRLLG